MSQVAEEFRQMLVYAVEDAAPNKGIAQPLVDFKTLQALIVAVLEDGRFTKADLPVITPVVQKLFNDYVRPYDMPGVPPFAEEFLDDILHDSIPFVLEKIFATVLPE